MAIKQIKLDFETVLNLLSLARRAGLNKAEMGELSALAIAEAKVTDVNEKVSPGSESGICVNGDHRMLTIQTERSTLSTTASKSHGQLNKEECFAENDTQTRIRIIGIDLAKYHCDLACFNERGKCVVEWPHISCPSLFAKLEQLPPACVLMESCNGSHDKVRRIADLNHDARLVNAVDVKALRNVRHKNDRRDAHYIANLFFPAGRLLCPGEDVGTAGSATADARVRRV